MRKIVLIDRLDVEAQSTVIYTKTLIHFILPLKVIFYVFYLTYTLQVVKLANIDGLRFCLSIFVVRREEMRRRHAPIPLTPSKSNFLFLIEDGGDVW